MQKFHLSSPISKNCDDYCLKLIFLSEELPVCKNPLKYKNRNNLKSPSIITITALLHLGH